MAGSISTANDKPIAAGPPVAGPNVNTDVADTPPQVPIAKAFLMLFHLLSGRIGADANAVQVRLQQKLDDIEDCTELLKGLSGWNTPPLKTPPDPLDPAYEDRIKKADGLYLNGISIPDSDYDTVKYTYGDPPTTAYSTFPVETFDGGRGNNNLVVGKVYNWTTSSTDTKYIVYLGPGPDKVLPSFAPAQSPLPLKTQHGTDFSSLTAGDLVKDLDTGKYYRVSNAKTGVEVTDFPLQKIVKSIDESEKAGLDAEINKKITVSSDLSKADSLEMQKLQGILSNVTTMCADIIATITTIMNSIANKT